MSVERTSDIPICPYWQRYFLAGENILALCGRNTPKEFPLPDMEGLRLPECPFQGSERGAFSAFEWPAILEVRPNPVMDGDDRDGFRDNLIERLGYTGYLRFAYVNEYLVKSGKKGRDGIEELEQVWDQQVNEFIERHSK